MGIMALMTDLAPLRKALILCTAVAVSAGLGGCNDKNLNETFAKIKAIDVDGTGVSSDVAQAKKLDQKDVQLLADTAKALTVGKEGLISQDAQQKLKIAIIDPLKMPREDAGQPLTMGTPSEAERAAMHDLPDLPIAAQAPLQKADNTGVRLIQVGSFSTAAAAETAWSQLQSQYPGIERVGVQYQKITTASGKSMVRLKVGPVENASQAEALCHRLNIQDAWCVKAG